VGTVTQQRWMSKLLGYDFTIEYKKGKENKVSDALSKVFEDPGLPGPTCSLISFPTPTWLQELKLSYDSDPKTLLLLQKLKDGFDIPKGYTLQQGLILRKGRIYIVQSSSFKEKILHYVHSNPQAGHLGYHKTLQRAKADFFWPGMRKDIRRLIRECDVCQASKVENIHPPGLLQPLPIPTKSWSDISLDFVEGLAIVLFWL
jgi:predicted ester cyclase